MDSDSLKTVAKTGKKRLWRRRWTAPCSECGTIVVWLDNTQPPVTGKRWSPWKMVEVFGERDGESRFWDGSIAFDPSRHVDHYPLCVRSRRRLAWILRQKEDDI
jgi:hypothetical protein